ncbi:MAG: hypothetical protein DRP76_04930, partial [Candidatus Omnitrophota bacterium]
MEVYYITDEEYRLYNLSHYEDGIYVTDSTNRFCVKVKSKIALKIIDAYRRRGKGTMYEPFVDYTRYGNYYRIDPVKGEVWQLTEEEYNKSTLPKYKDGIRVSSPLIELRSLRYSPSEDFKRIAKLIEGKEFERAKAEIREFLKSKDKGNVEAMILLSAVLKAEDIEFRKEWRKLFNLSPKSPSISIDIFDVRVKKAYEYFQNFIDEMRIRMSMESEFKSEVNIFISSIGEIWLNESVRVYLTMFGKQEKDLIEARDAIKLLARERLIEFPEEMSIIFYDKFIERLVDLGRVWFSLMKEILEEIELFCKFQLDAPRLGYITPKEREYHYRKIRCQLKDYRSLIIWFFRNLINDYAYYTEYRNEEWISNLINFTLRDLFDKDVIQKVKGGVLEIDREFQEKYTSSSSSLDKENNSSLSTALIFGGGSGTLFYIKAFKGFFNVIRSITPFDGGIFYSDKGELLSQIEDNPSSSGELRQSVEGLPALGDVSKVIVEHLEDGYVKDFMNARFTKDKLFLGKEVINIGNVKTLEDIIEAIHKNYKGKRDEKEQQSYRDFLNMLKRYARIIKESGIEIFDETKNKLKFRHSLKNLLLYALILEQKGKDKEVKERHYNKAVEKFVEILGLEKHIAGKTILTCCALGDLELVAELENGKYLCGQEEITQNLSGKKSFGSIKKIKNVFFACREDIKSYLEINKGRPINRRKGRIEPADYNYIQANLKLNPLLEKIINDIEESNKKAPAYQKNLIIFGPGSQFSSVIIHLMIPGMIKKLFSLKHTPRILVLNPIKDVETGGIKDEEYFEHIINIIKSLIEKELGSEESISSIFDFIMINDVRVNPEKVTSRATKEEKIKTRGKKRFGLIKFKVKKKEEI